MFISPAVAGDLVYVGSCSGSYYAFDRSDGTVRWSHDTSNDGESAQFHGDALITDELVLVGADAQPTAHLYAFDRDGGEVRWKHPFPGGVAVDLVQHGGAVLATSMSGEVLSMEIASGAVNWITAGPEDLPAYQPPTDPTLADGTFYVPWRSGDLDAYDADSGERLWRRRFDASPNTSVTAVDGAVLVGLMDGSLHRVDPGSGESRSSIELGWMLYGELVPVGGCVLTLSRGEEGDRISCVEPDLSGVRWSHLSESDGDWGTFQPLLRGGQVVAGAEDSLVGLSAKDGSVLWRLEFDGLPRGLGSSADALYVGKLSGPVLGLPWPE